ncbi:unnamed protein product [Rhizophagus irregularis]|uniref:Uncharacterized protein n=1 Tax=Rhizophagus irregularis TaxID=588596 RepID=A0A915Z3M6_9GLOM|nr:unnamed protein product [Rhizophagus irregularis]
MKNPFFVEYHVIKIRHRYIVGNQNRLGRLAVWRQMPKKSFGRGQNPKAAGYSGSIRADNVLVSSTG